MASLCTIKIDDFSTLSIGTNLANNDKPNKTQVKSVQLGKTLDLNISVFSFPPRDRVKCGGLGVRMSSALKTGWPSECLSQISAS